MKFNLIINIGDIILQTRDNIIFTLVKKDKNYLYLEYYDNHIEDIKTVLLTREALKHQFETRSEELKLIRVVK